jgi:hypothetical protein
MNKKAIIGTIFVILMLVGTINVVAYSKETKNRQNENKIMPTPDNGIGLMQRLMNRARDMLGICQGDCELEELSGVFSYEEPYFYIGEVEVHFGPSWFIENAESNIDFDGDGEKELIYDELMGLIGTTIVVEGHYQSDGWMSVFTINGETYREPGQPIWASQHQFRWRKKDK